MAVEDYGINLGEKLSSEDRQFLLDRNYWREVQANDEEHGVQGDQPPSPYINPVTETPEALDRGLQGDGTGQAETPDAVDGDDVTKDDLKGILDARGVEYKSNATKDELLALVNEPIGGDEDDSNEESGE